MQRMFAAGLALAFGSIAAQAVAGEVTLRGVSHVAQQPGGHDGLSPTQDAEVVAEMQANMAKLGLDLAPKTAKDASALAWPLLLDTGLAGNGRAVASGHVDHNPAFPNQLRDFSCGTRTYDTAAGYNHRGTDLGLWPFAWQSMAQDAVAVTAAAAGTIVLKRDGRFDRNCSMDVPDDPNMVFVQHDDGTVARYLHLKKDSVTTRAIGQRVAEGEYLGIVGSSGISTGPHLHFELLSSAQTGSTVIDPYAGQCNAVASRWAEQPAYLDPRLISVAIHDAPPQIEAGCGVVEQPNYTTHVAPGGAFHFAAYYADQVPGRPATLVLREPDGSEAWRHVHTPTAADMNNAEYYAASYWYFNMTVPADAPAGRWTAEVTYEGHTERTSFLVGPAVYAASGLWFNPAQSGHGFTLEVIDAGGVPHLSVAWFTYLDGAPRWLFGLAPIANGGATVPVLLSDGGQFPPAYDPADVEFAPWGTLRFTFTGESAGRVEWQSTIEGFGNGALDLQRVATASDINLDNFDTGMRACASGSWFNPQQSGHGLQLLVSGEGANRQLLVAWYVYENGKQLWLSGAGPVQGNRATVALNRTTGAQFPPDFDPADLVVTPWGTATFTLIDPRRMRIDWGTAPNQQSLALERSTEIMTAACR